MVSPPSCPFFPSKQTFVSTSGTSDMCQKRTFSKRQTDERDARALAVSAALSIEGRQDLKADYLSFNNAAANSPTSGFMKNVLSRGIIFTSTPSTSSSHRNNWADSDNGDRNLEAVPPLGRTRGRRRGTVEPGARS
jgi:hypothetical protein